MKQLKQFRTSQWHSN